MKKKIVIPYFPAWFKYTSPLIAGAGVYCLLIGYTVGGIFLIVLGTIVFTTQYVTLVDLEERKCKDYLSFVGMHLNMDSINFINLDRIIVTKGKYKQSIKSQIQDRQFDWADYTATLLMDNDKRLTLLTTNSKVELFEGIKEFSEFMKVDVEDRTTNEFYWVDMEKV